MVFFFRDTKSKAILQQKIEVSTTPHFPNLLAQQLQLLHLDERNPRLIVLNGEGDQMPMILAAVVRQLLPKSYNYFPKRR